jgi:hypothetical protein
LATSHNDLTFRASRWILEELRTGTPSWTVSDLTSKITLGSWFDPWPRPDITYFDATTDRSLAVEFKPPGHGKREYVTGLGQCLTYLNAFDYALLVTPQVSFDGFEIADYLAETIRSAPLQSVPLGILAYKTDPASDMSSIEPLRVRTGKVKKTRRERKAFWGYWRDLSHYDVFELLGLVDSRGTFDSAWTTFWKTRLKVGKSRQWNGTFRKPWKATSFDSHKLNVELSLRHADLVASDGRATQHGLELLQLGKVYGADSRAFLDELARRILIEARHIELIYWVSEVQPTIKASARKRSGDYLLALEKELVSEGVIRPPKRHSKPAFIRDEPKLWNKLELLRRQTTTRYFWSGTGLMFDWRRITGVMAGS